MNVTPAELTLLAEMIDFVRSRNGQEYIAAGIDSTPEQVVKDMQALYAKAKVSSDPGGDPLNP